MLPGCNPPSPHETNCGPGARRGGGGAAARGGMFIVWRAAARTKSTRDTRQRSCRCTAGMGFNGLWDSLAGMGRRVHVGDYRGQTMIIDASMV
jgi:hypothetical protein